MIVMGLGSCEKSITGDSKTITGDSKTITGDSKTENQTDQENVKE